MKIKFTTIDKEGNPLPDDQMNDELVIYLNQKSAKGNAIGLATAVEAMEKKPSPTNWTSFKMKGKINIHATP